MSLPWRRDLGLGDAEAVDPVADDVDGDVERVGLELADRRQDDRDAALQVEAEHRLVVARDRREEGPDDEDHRADQEDDVPAHGSVVARAVVGRGARRAPPGRSTEVGDLRDRVAGDRDDDARRDLELDARRRRARGSCRRSRRW